MKKIILTAMASSAALALTACGTAEDASADAEAENVEMAADEALADVTEVPVEDEAAATTEAEANAEAVEAEAEDAGEAAAATVRDIEAIANEAAEEGEAAARDTANDVIDRAADAAREEVNN